MARFGFSPLFAALLLSAALPASLAAAPIPDGCAPLNVGTTFNDNSGAATTAAQVGDWDGDGARDIAWLHQGTSEVELWFGDGGADFQIAPVEVPPIRDALTGRVNLMVNLANDAIGYIIPKSEWDNEAPWIYGETEETYGEIVSLGEDTAPTLHNRLMSLLRDVAQQWSDGGPPRTESSHEH